MEPHHGQRENQWDEEGDKYYPGPILPPLGVTARATVKRVIDGDTLIVELSVPVRIRLKDCYAPEVRGADYLDGVKSKEYMKSIAKPGTKVRISVDTEAANGPGDLLSFERLLADVWVDETSTSLAQMMIDAGHARKTKE